MLLINIFLASIVLWVLFIMVANLYHNSYKNAKGLKRKAMIAFAYVFVTLDVIYNYTYASLIFWQLPSWDHRTLTSRLKYNLAEETGWRFKLSLFVCAKMIEPWDWNHCGLYNNSR